MILDLGQETCTTGVEYLTVQEAKSATPQRAEVTLTVLSRAERLMVGQCEHQDGNMGNGRRHATYIQKNMSS